MMSIHDISCTHAKKSRLLLVLLCMLLIGTLAGCTNRQSNIQASKEQLEIDQQPLITIGSKSFTTEQILYGKLTAFLLRNQGFQVKEMVFKDSQPIRKALESGVINLYWEYANTARIFYQQQPPIMDAGEAYRTVATEDEKKGLIWLNPSQFLSPWVVLISKELAEKRNINTISQLATYSRQPSVKLKAAAYAEFIQRDDGKAKLDEVYGLAIQPEDWFQSENALVFQAVKDARVQVGVGIAFDGRIREYHLTVLEDDQHAFPPYQAVPVIRAKTLADYPSLKGLLNKLSDSLTKEKFAELTYQVDALHRDVAQVANAYLIDEGLIQQNE
ncbi:hypothetical protein EDM56_26310 [Brevibacillus fluminis]|uniref:ABC-type glycine betaine transport system substrate-binding domain-containing protein n=1 Tax=Brevibacillus fluminis TaxID=511487 RepID=A0A3M8CZK4_9BACL|nr:glycine betaine ABC transporter substrate-binding protein [Brevibacillus fluminis]RNB81234.1 hypothetical protein EDM56_26310 [Brevibacillus fluminis]